MSAVKIKMVWIDGSEEKGRGEADKEHIWMHGFYWHHLAWHVSNFQFQLQTLRRSCRNVALSTVFLWSVLSTCQRHPRVSLTSNTLDIPICRQPTHPGCLTPCTLCFFIHYQYHATNLYVKPHTFLNYDVYSILVTMIYAPNLYVNYSYYFIIICCMMIYKKWKGRCSICNFLSSSDSHHASCRYIY